MPFPSSRSATCAAPRRPAFTLIELLVVIAIIAILAAILFPVFAQAREKARQTACLSNQKQIGTGLMMYNQDYDETFPVRYGANDPTDGHQWTWKDMLAPYIKNKDVFRCPSNPSAKLFDSKGVFPGGYSMYLPDGPLALIAPGTAYPQPLAGVDQPASALVIVESSYKYPDVGPYLAYKEPASVDANITPGPSSWNSGHSKQKFNIVYLDGHSKYLALKDTCNETSSLNEWRFNKADADAKGYAWFYTLLTNLQSYPSND